MNIHEIITKYWSHISACALAIWAVVQYISGKAQRSAILAKSNGDILNDRIAVLRDEVVELRANKVELLKANDDCTKSKTTLDQKVAMLEVDVKKLRNELTKKNIIKDDNNY